MAEPCLDKTCTVCGEKWRDLFGAAVEGPNSVECDKCGMVVGGDKPTIVITCFICFQNQSA